MKSKRLLLVLFLLLNFCVGIQEAQSFQWQTKKSEHFLIQYPKTSVNDGQAVRILSKAEDYYVKIARQVGYQRYSKFWTWDDRVKIVLYPDQKNFVKATGQPIWAIGGVKRESGSHKTHTIVSYLLEDKFLEEVLPHEICHLILHDYVGDRNNIPTWFDEGLAQIFEDKKIEKSDKFLRKYLKSKQAISIDDLFTFNIDREINPLKISLFYIQSVSLVHFLIKKYGNYNFEQLCNYLKEGIAFKEAFRRAYLGMIDSSEQLEKKWLSSMAY